MLFHAPPPWQTSRVCLTGMKNQCPIVADDGNDAAAAAAPLPAAAAATTSQSCWISVAWFMEQTESSKKSSRLISRSCVCPAALYRNGFAEGVSLW
jgi:hypothetical protein